MGCPVGVRLGCYCFAGAGWDGKVVAGRDDKGGWRAGWRLWKAVERYQPPDSLVEVNFLPSYKGWHGRFRSVSHEHFSHFLEIKQIFLAFSEPQIIVGA